MHNTTASARTAKVQPILIRGCFSAKILCLIAQLSLTFFFDPQRLIMFETYLPVVTWGSIRVYGWTYSVAGATTGLIAVYSFVGMFYDPYASGVYYSGCCYTSIGDSFCGVVSMNGAAHKAPMQQ